MELPLPLQPVPLPPAGPEPLLPRPGFRVASGAGVGPLSTRGA